MAGDIGTELGIGILLDQGVDLETMLSALVDQVADRLQCERATLFLLDRHAGELFTRAAHLPELQEIRLPLGQGIAGVVAQTRTSLMIEAPYDDARFDANVDRETGFTTRNMVVAPVFAEPDGLVGVVQVLNRVSGDFSKDDLAKLETVAQEVGALLARTSVLGELRAAASKRQPASLAFRYNDVVGSSTAIQQIYVMVDRAASTDASVLILGETGTGKGLIARAIHLNSERRDKPFVMVDCGSLPPNLVESELFGHESGAFTGASRRFIGRVERAAGGTLFVDEVGELPLAQQSRLLRVLQERTFERVGGSDTIRSDFRLIAATNRNLEAAVERGEFRADLYYRLRVVPMLMPTLRERGPEDIKRLAEHFLEIFARRHRRGVARIGGSAMQRLLKYHWPGNIRELENCIESAVVLSADKVIQENSLSLPRYPARDKVASAPDLTRPLAEVEKDYVRDVVADCDGNISLAARRLGVTRNTVMRKLGADAQR